jgi:hypothetical protein
MRAINAVCVTVLLATTTAAFAQPVTDPGAELAFMPQTISVTLLNEGGKYVAIDLKRIPQGGTCRMDKDTTIIRVGPGEKEGVTRVRNAVPQISSGGCPFLTLFDMPTADYQAARVAFKEREAEASRKVEQLKKDLGDKWDEVTGKKS